MTERELNCTFPNCKDCAEYGCDSRNYKSKPKRNRTDYQKDYYQRHKAEIQSKYASKSIFLRYVTVKSTIRKLSKQIGSANVAIVLDAIEQIEKE